MSRRDFLPAAAFAVGACTTVQKQGAMARQRIGIQLWTLRALIAEIGVEPVLRALAAIGYEEIEPFDLHGRTVEDWAAMLRAAALTAPSVHCSVAQFDDDFGGLAARATALGHQYLVVASLPEELRGSLANYRALAKRFNAYGARCRDIGATFAFHNHDVELTAVNGVNPYDVLLAETDPALVAFEMDIYWVRFAGADPLALFQAHPGRFHLAHIKDMTSDRQMADVGDGVVDFAAILVHADRAGLRHLFVERDDANDPLVTARRSYTALRLLLLETDRARARMPLR